MNTMDTHTLSIILSYHKENLAKVSFTCKEWNSTNSKFNDEVKMKYLADTSFKTREKVYLELDKEMFNVSKGFVPYEDYYTDWRDEAFEDEHQINWYAWRKYSFFYKQAIKE